VRVFKRPAPSLPSDPPKDAKLLLYDDVVPVALVEGSDPVAYDPDPRPFPWRPFEIGHELEGPVSRERWDAVRARSRVERLRPG
jgi:hypothetical protein